MPKLSKYKAAGRTAGSYQRSIGDVNKLGLGLQHAQWKGEEQRSLYGAIGGSVANIIGIIKEKKMLGELNKLKESAGGLPGIVKESEEYQPMGKFGEILGLDKKRKDVFKSRFTGEEISDTMLYGIGKSEALRQGSTMYGDVQAISDKLASGEGYNPVRDKAFAQVGATSQEEYDKLTDVDLFDTEEEQSPITEPKAIKDVQPEKPRPPSINDNVVSSIVEDNDDEIFTTDSLSKGQKNIYSTVGEIGGDYASKVAFIESSFGSIQGARGDVFQYGGQNKDMSIEDQTNYFLNENKQRTKNFEKEGYYSIGMSLGMDKDLVNYIAHQQGSLGAQDILSSTKSGVFKKGRENERISNMLGNLRDKDRFNMIEKYGKGAPGVIMSRMGKSDIKSFSSDFLNYQVSYWNN